MREIIDAFMNAPAVELFVLVVLVMLAVWIINRVWGFLKKLFKK